MLAALIVTALRALALLAAGLRALPAYLPIPAHPVMRIVAVGAGMAVGYLEAATGALSTHALVYVGLTGDAFFVSARRARGLTAGVESGAGGAGSYRRRFRTERASSFSYLNWIVPLTRVTAPLQHH